MAVASDILIGSRAVRDIDGWKSVDRIVVVNEVEGSSWLGKVNAARASAGLVMGGEHPQLENLFLKELRTECKATDVVKFVARYDRLVYNEEVVEINSAVRETTVYRDYAGNMMTLTDADGKNEKGVRLKKFAPQMTYIATKSGRLSGASTLRDEAQNYVGFINASSWNGGAAYTWLVISIKSTSVDSGNKWTTVYQVQYNPDTWDKTEVYIDPDTGFAIPNPDDNANAEKTFVIYGTANFSSLGIT